MLTPTHLQQIKDFADPYSGFDHLYGSAVLGSPETPNSRPIGTLVINSKCVHPIDYFIDGNTIGGYPATQFLSIHITRRNLATETVETLIIP